MVVECGRTKTKNIDFRSGKVVTRALEEGQKLKSLGSWTPSCPPRQLSTIILGNGEQAQSSLTVKAGKTSLQRNLTATSLLALD